MSWLDDHSSAVQAVATLILVVITGVYVWLTHRSTKAATSQATTSAMLLAVAEQQLRLVKDDQMRRFLQPIATLAHSARFSYRLQADLDPASRTFVTDALAMLPTAAGLATIREAAVSTGIEEVLEGANRFCGSIEVAKAYLVRARDAGTTPDPRSWDGYGRSVGEAGEALINRLTVALGDFIVADVSQVTRVNDPKGT